MIKSNLYLLITVRLSRSTLIHCSWYESFSLSFCHQIWFPLIPFYFDIHSCWDELNSTNKISLQKINVCYSNLEPTKTFCKVKNFLSVRMTQYFQVCWWGSSIGTIWEYLGGFMVQSEPLDHWVFWDSSAFKMQCNTVSTGMKSPGQSKLTWKSTVPERWEFVEHLSWSIDTALYQTVFRNKTF